MAKPDYLLCDICGGKVHEDSRLFVATGLSPDPAGGSSQEDGEHVDLCEHDAMRAVAFLIRNQVNNQRDHEAGKRLLKWLQDEQRRSRKPVVLTNR